MPRFIKFALYYSGIIIFLIAMALAVRTPFTHVYLSDLLLLVSLMLIAYAASRCSSTKMGRFAFYNWTGTKTITPHLQTSLFFMQAEKKPNRAEILRQLTAASKKIANEYPDTKISIASPLCDPRLMKRLGFISQSSRKTIYLRYLVYCLIAVTKNDRIPLMRRAGRLMTTWTVMARDL